MSARIWTRTGFATLAAAAVCWAGVSFATDPTGGDHLGPEVAKGTSGPARWVGKLYDAFDEGRAMDTVRFADRFYREPANDGYNAVLDYVKRELKKAGFGSDERLELYEIETEMELPSWTPHSASLAMVAPDGTQTVLHAFEDQAAADRTMLPRNAPSADVEGEVVFGLGDVSEGKILVTEARLRRDLLSRAHKAGAAAVISSSLMSFNVDPTGAERHLDAIQYRVMRREVELPIAEISPRSLMKLRVAAQKHGSVRLKFQADVTFEERPLRTLVATVVGKERPAQAVSMCSHIQEPGACDNATGVAGLLESAVNLAGLLHDGKVEWPQRTLVFLWGDEFTQTRAWFDHTKRQAIAGISSDMTGQSKARTGAIALLERMPDPGAVVVLPPDEHTPWGANPVRTKDLRPNGINVIARCAMADVGARVGTWETREHPWEGGSDHDVFIERGIPAVLFWHFTDYAYHTSLDRVDKVDPEEMHRTAVALLATALALADPREGDLDRYLASLKLEEDLRIGVAQDRNSPEVERMWKDWCKGARNWLRAHCFGLPYVTEEPPQDDEEKDG